MLREERGLTGLARNLVISMRAVFERRPGEAIESAKTIFDAFPDPEMVFFAARNIAFFGERRALQELERSLERGFVLYRVLLRDDPWFDPLRSTPKFQFLLERSREAYRQCRTAYLDAGGEHLLGPVPSPEELETVFTAGTLPQNRRHASQTKAPAGERAVFKATLPPSDQTPPSTSAG